MSPDDDDLTAAERRARDLLAPLREGTVPAAPELVPSVRRTLGWQRPLRRAVEGPGRLAGAVLDGVRGLLGGRRP
jgi:hypothetical protein